jgi:Zn-dependent M28 family amino/carboxypeptidase
MRALLLLAACTADPPRRDILPVRVDPEIREMVDAVDAARIEADVRKLVSFGTRHSLSDGTSETRGVGAAARWVRARFAEAGADATLQDYVAPPGKRVPREWPMQNVVAVVHGTDRGPDARTLVVSGHLDSRAKDVANATIDAPGANDDASGVAVALEACRVMARHRFRATVVFAAVTGEEQGLLGSAALAKRLSDERTRIEGMITNDIVGASVSTTGHADKSRVRVFSPGLPFDPAARDALLAVGGENDGPARQLARAIAESAEIYVRGFGTMLVFRLDRYLRGGDHRPFHEAGFPAARMTEVEENFRRQHEDVREGFGDTIEHVDVEYAANVARVNVAALASLARAPAAPNDVRLDVRTLANDSRLVWTPVADESVTYEVVARPTDAPTWTRALSAGRSGDVTVPISKDHFHLGLRAVDASGHRSRVVFPMPLREGDPWPPR